VLGAAVVGAVLQNQLAVALRDRAVQDAAQLPTPLQQRFVEGFNNVVQSGLQVGPGQSGVAQQLPPGIPPQLADLLRQLGHDVFVNGFIAAMKPALEVSIVVLVLGVISTLAVTNIRKAPAHDGVQEKRPYGGWTAAQDRGPVR